MTQKTIGWIALPACIAMVTIAVVGARWAIPRTAQAAVPQSQSNVVPAETTEACQIVLSQIATIQQILIDEKQSRTIKPQTAMDELVAQEYRIDTSKCPTDFRMAVLRFVTAEDAMCIHTHMDRAGKIENALGAFVGIVGTKGLSAVKSLQSLNDYNKTITDEQKQDLAKIQSAMLDLAQVAMKYGVK